MTLPQRRETRPGEGHACARRDERLPEVGLHELRPREHGPQLRRALDDEAAPAARFLAPAVSVAWRWLNKIYSYYPPIRYSPPPNLFVVEGLR
jgi:hypothetical protein